jgi:hypothetical protein
VDECVRVRITTYGDLNTTGIGLKNQGSEYVYSCTCTCEFVFIAYLYYCMIIIRWMMFVCIDNDL